METVRYSLIGKEDIRLEPRGGSFEVTLADGSVAILSALDVAYLLADAYNSADVPSNLSVGQLYRQKDGIRGLWAINQAGSRYHLDGEAVNVKEFGAKGDDSTDDTTAIQAAVDAVTSGGNGVYFPPGNYVVSATLTLKSNAVLFGAGPKISTLKMTSGKTEVNLFTMTNLSNVVIAGLGIQGDSRTFDNDGNRTLGNGIFSSGSSHCLVKDCYFTKCHNGVFVTGGTGFKVFDSEFYITHAAYTCVYFRSHADGHISRNYMRQDLAAAAGVLYPIYALDSSSNITALMVTNNHVSDNMNAPLFSTAGIKSIV